MLASLTDAPLVDPDFVYEPKYDGIRAIAEVSPRAHASLWSRLGNEKTHQFPEVADALDKWARSLQEPVALDGEIVALDAKGEPTGFQQLQGRIHVAAEKRGRGSFSSPEKGRKTAVQSAENDPRPLFSVAYIVFDILRIGRTDLRDRPLLERRAALERLLAPRGRTPSPVLRLSEMVRGDGRALYKRALTQGWEGLIAKVADSVYTSGKRTPDWRKLKIVQEQEFIIAGWTEPRHTRSYFGALLLGVYETADSSHRRGRRGRGGSAGSPASSAVDRSLVYAGHTGTGFTERELARLMKLLKPLEITECPFRQRPRTNQRPHWVQPKLVAQIKFTEWTADGKLRHPVYLGLRDDKEPEEVAREPEARLHETSTVRLKPDTTGMNVRLKPDATTAQGTTAQATTAQATTAQARAITKSDVASGFSRTEIRSLIDQLRALENSRRDGVLVLPDGDRLNVSNLYKLFWPQQKLTKGDLFRYYVEVSPFILPAVADRPLVMKRSPNGVTGEPFYQHRVANVPAGVRVATVTVAEKRPQLVGGNLKTLLYMTQLAAISQDPWFSRIGSIEYADYVAVDLDPAPRVRFTQVIDVARWVRDELDLLGAVGVPKTSGADGLHVYVPLPRGTPYDAGLLFCKIIATVVAQKHPRHATVERSVAARGRRVYVDCLQNILGKTLVTAYSARTSRYAGVSTPLTWREVDDGVRREDFTIQTVPDRLKEVGDLWATLRTAKPVDLSRVARYGERTGKRLLKGGKS